MRAQYLWSRGRRGLMVSRNARYRASNLPVSSISSRGDGSLLLFRVGAPLACRNQTPQTAVDVRAPCVRADIEALVFGNQSQMSEAHLRLVPLSRDLEADFRALPLGSVFGEAEVVLQHAPDDLRARDEFGNFDSAAMDILVPIRE